MQVPPKSEFQMLREKMMQTSKQKEEKKAQHKIDLANKRLNEESMKSMSVSFQQNDNISQIAPQSQC